MKKITSILKRVAKKLQKIFTSGPFKRPVVRYGTLFVTAFALIGAYQIFFTKATTPFGEIKRGANDLVLRYDRKNKDDALKSFEFPEDYLPAMALYGNGLMVCNSVPDAGGFITSKQRTLTAGEVDTVIRNVREKGFDELIARADSRSIDYNYNSGSIYDPTTQLPDDEEYQNGTGTGGVDSTVNPLTRTRKGYPVGAVASIAITTSVGKRSTNPYPEDLALLDATAAYLDSECARAITDYSPDDITVYGMRTGTTANNSLRNLPSSQIPTDGAVGEAKPKRVTGTDAVNIKKDVGKSVKTFKGKDKKEVRVRYQLNLPIPNASAPVVKRSGAQKVEAAADLKVRFLFVYAADQPIPANASTVINTFASAVSNYYKTQVGKQFDTANVQMVQGARTVAQYTTCPQGENCAFGSYSPKWLASHFNLRNEFTEVGYSTYVGYLWDIDVQCGGWGGINGSESLPNWGFTSHNWALDDALNFCGKETLLQQIGAHELGHSFGLDHIEDGLLMSSSRTSSLGLNIGLNSSQAEFLRTKSAFFGSFAPAISLTASSTTIQAGQAVTISWSTSNTTECNGNEGWDANTGASTTIPLNGSRVFTPMYSQEYAITCKNSYGSITRSVYVNVTSVTPPQPPSNPDYKPLNPARLMDTRYGATTSDGGYAGIGQRWAGSITSITVTNRGGVDANAKAVSLNVTATNTAGDGFITIYPCGTQLPNSSIINYRPNMTIANNIIVKVGLSGQVCVYTYAATDVIIDVNGYLPSYSSYVPLTPARLIDSRPGAGTIDGQYAGIGVRSPNTITSISVLGRGGVPSNAKVVEVTVTATGVSGWGYMRLFPCGSMTEASTVNYTFAGQTIANTALVNVGTNGSICVYTSPEASANLIVDVAGAFTTSSYVTSLVPARLMDTRGGTTVDGNYRSGGLLPSGSVMRMQVTGRGGVPAGSVAAALNVTATGANSWGFVTIFPCDQGQPNASNLNFNTGDSIANGVIAKLDSSGAVCIYNYGSTYLLVDVTAAFPGSIQ